MKKNHLTIYCIFPEKYSNINIKTGQSGDKACNIYDMSGNISEWTTETATNSTGKCTYIGGGIGQQQGTAFSRYVSDTVSKSNSISFRVIMYIDN